MNISKSRQELIDFIHDYYEKRNLMYVNRSIFSNDQLILEYGLISNPTMEENELDVFFNSVINNSNENECKGWLCYLTGQLCSYTNAKEIYDIGIKKYNNHWCIFENAVYYYEGEESIKMLEKILDIVPLSCLYLAQIYADDDKKQQETIELYAKYLRYIKDGIIKNPKYTIPINYLFEALNQSNYDYNTSKKYIKISNILKSIIPINGLIDIVMQFY